MTKMRFRTDSITDAADRKWLDEGHTELCHPDCTIHNNPEYREKVLGTEPPVAGDTWRLTFQNGNTAGYAIVCPGCGNTHYWSRASNCDHQGHAQFESCWQWTGSAEDNTLTATPSLFAQGECGWHGWLRDGVLTSV